MSVDPTRVTLLEALGSRREAFSQSRRCTSDIRRDARIRAEAPYDFIYHVGMIGCVSDPVKLTRELLALLKPGGILLFNAPNFRNGATTDKFFLCLEAMDPKFSPAETRAFLEQFNAVSVVEVDH